MPVALTVQLSKLRENVLAAQEICARYGVGLVGVVKGLSGQIAICKHLAAAGMPALADSRVANLRALRCAGIQTELVLLRPPCRSEVRDCIEHSDASFNVDIGTLRELSREAVAMGKQHRVFLVVDMDGSREGLSGDALRRASRAVVQLPNLRLGGFALYFTRRHTDVQYMHTVEAFLAEAREAEADAGCDTTTTSVGSSGAFGSFVRTGGVPAGLNQLRVGTALLLGMASSEGPEYIAGFHRDAFAIDAEIMQLGGREGDGRRAVLHIGRVDVGRCGLVPSESVSIVDITADHTVVRLGNQHASSRVGDTIRVSMNYYGLTQALLSPYTRTMLT